MKKYYAYRTDEHGERWNWEDCEDTVIVTAKSVEEAAEIFRSSVDQDYAEELEKYLPPTKIEDFEEWKEHNPYWTEWK